MARVNLTLDDDTQALLARHAKRAGARHASLARDLIREGLQRRETAARRRKLAADYASGRADQHAMLADFEALQAGLDAEEA